MLLARIALAVFLAGGAVLAPLSAGDETPTTLGKAQDQILSNVEWQFVAAAEAMPEDKYGFAPTDGEFKEAKAFAVQVRHVAAVNYLLGASIRREKSPVDTGDGDGPAALTSKADVLKYLRESFAYLHKALDAITPANATASIPSPFGRGTTTRLGLSTRAISHAFDHYGQMVVYLRMNGIIPPASRPQ